MRSTLYQAGTMRPRHSLMSAGGVSAPFNIAQAFSGGLLFKASSSIMSKNSSGDPAGVGDPIYRVESEAANSTVFGIQTTSANGPILRESTFKYLEFGGSHWFDIGNLATDTGDHTVIFVFQSEANDTAEAWLLDSQAGRFVFADRASASNSPQYAYRHGFYVSGWMTRPVPSNQVQIVSYRFSGNQCDIRRNGLSTGILDYTPSKFGSSTNLGSNYDQNYAFFKGKLIAVAACQGALSYTDLLRAEIELASEANIEHYLSDTYTEIVAVGDSITFGFNDDIKSDDKTSDNRIASQGWTPILSDALSGRLGQTIIVSNEGYNGATSDEVLAKVPDILLHHPHASTFLICIGHNDATASFPSNGGQGLSPGDAGYAGTYKDYVQQIVDLLLAANKQVRFAQVPYAVTDVGKEYVDGRIQACNTVIDELVAANSLSTDIPQLYNYFKNHQSELSADGTHPTGIGYQSLASLWDVSLGWELTNLFTSGSNGLILPIWDTSSLYINSDGSEYTLKNLFDDGSDGLILPIWDPSSMDINAA